MCQSVLVKEKLNLKQSWKSRPKILFLHLFNFPFFSKCFAAPGPVFNLSYEVIGSIIQLFWQPPLQPNGNIRWYHISYTMIGPANSTDSMDNSTTISSSTGDLLQGKCQRIFTSLLYHKTFRLLSSVFLFCFFA